MIAIIPLNKPSHVHHWQNKENASSPSGGTSISHSKGCSRRKDEDLRKIMEYIKIICMYYIEMGSAHLFTASKHLAYS